jgi:hypothetical protein
MLPAGINFEMKEGKTFDPLPEDVYQVELFDIELQEKPSYNDKTVMEKVMSFQFVVLDEGGFRGRSIWKNFVPTYLYIGNNGKNALYQITEAIIARELKDEEIATFGSDFINKLVGYQCRVTVKNKESKEGKFFSNIDTFLPKKVSLTRLTSEEKEKSVVKHGKEETGKNAFGKENSEIPTIQLDEEEFMTNHQGDNMSDSNNPEVQIVDVPF